MGHRSLYPGYFCETNGAESDPWDELRRRIDSTSRTLSGAEHASRGYRLRSRSHRAAFSSRASAGRAPFAARPRNAVGRTPQGPLPCPASVPPSGGSASGWRQRGWERRPRKRRGGGGGPAGLGRRPGHSSSRSGAGSGPPRPPPGRLQPPGRTSGTVQRRRRDLRDSGATVLVRRRPWGPPERRSARPGARPGAPRPSFTRGPSETQCPRRLRGRPYSRLSSPRPPVPGQPVSHSSSDGRGAPRRQGCGHGAR